AQYSLSPCYVSLALYKCLYGRAHPTNLQHHRHYTSGESSGAAKVVAVGLVTLGSSIGGTVLYAKWDPKFRTAVEKNIPYSDWLLGMALGPNPYSPVTAHKKQVKESRSSKIKKEKNIKEEPSVSTASETTSAPVYSAQSIEGEYTGWPIGIAWIFIVFYILTFLFSVSASLEESLASSAKTTLQAIGAQEAALQAIGSHTHKLKEAMEAEVPPDQKSAQWRDLETALAERRSTVNDAGAALLKARDALDSLRSVIDKAKESKVAAVQPLVLAAEENLHSMVVDLDQAVTKVQSAESEAKIVSQYTELVNEAKRQFQKELSSLTPEIQANWKGLTGKLSADDLNALIAHAHRRIDQLNRELAEQRVREQVHIEAALEQQKLEDQKALDKAVHTATQHSKEEARLEQERKLSELREVMEAEMRTQLRRQAAAHTDHLRDILKVQEQELRSEAEQVLNSKMLEQETHYRQLTQEQLDNFTLDMNAAYARLKGMEEAIDSHVIAEEEARKAHQLWLSVEALSYTLKTAGSDLPTKPLESAVQAIQDSCCNNEFALALASALPEESLRRGVYSEASLRSRFNSLRSMVRRVALIDESHNSLYQYFLSYLQAALLFEEKQAMPPTQLTNEDLDPFKLLSYASYCLEHEDLELAAKFVNQLRGEARRVVQDWLTEARLTLETRQVVTLLSAYANAVGLGTTQAP
uniref:MICOS complex subunit MIC60 n=1 Tax=Myripristis murdjan TaxID=586833 RepID=A0A667XCT7_9TELE